MAAIDDQRRLAGLWVVVELDMGAEPEHVFGPFDSEDEANAWSLTTGPRYQSIMPLRAPAEHSKHTRWAR